MFRFSIRDVLWLMVVVGLALGWANSSANWSRRDKALLDQMFKVESEYNRLLYNHDDAWAALDAAGVKWSPPHEVYRWYKTRASKSPDQK